MRETKTNNQLKPIPMKEGLQVTNFKDFVETVENKDLEDQIYLPITHIPDWTKLGAIMGKKQLTCSTGNKNYEEEALLFFTYGRNTFIPKNKQNLENDVYPPLAFLFDMRQLGFNPKRMLPFDSGAFDKYKLAQGIELERFELGDPSKEDSLKLVVLLYKNYQNYIGYKHDFLHFVKKYNLFPELRVLNEMYSKQMTESSEIGPQGRSIEIQYNCPVSLQPLLILYPHIYAGEAYDPGQLMLAFPDIDILMYTSSTPAGGGPKVYRNFINDTIEEYIKNHEELFKWKP
jgi:hypothetical protein